MMLGRPARERAFALLNRDLRRAARRSGAPALTITETSNRDVRYPELVPTLLDWYEHVDAKARFDQPATGPSCWTRSPAPWSPPDAPREQTFGLAVGYLDSHPPVPRTSLQGSTLLAAHHASPSDSGDRAAMARLAADRFLGEGRAPILEWLIARKVSHRHPELLDVAAGELEDPSVAAHIMRRLRRLPLDALPDGLAGRVRLCLEAEQEETRTQARLLLEKMGI
jgi:hypothetical protein